MKFRNLSWILSLRRGSGSGEVSSLDRVRWGRIKLDISNMKEFFESNELLQSEKSVSFPKRNNGKRRKIGKRAEPRKVFLPLRVWCGKEARRGRMV